MKQLYHNEAHNEQKELFEYKIFRLTLTLRIVLFRGADSEAVGGKRPAQTLRVPDEERGSHQTPAMSKYKMRTILLSSFCMRRVLRPPQRSWVQVGAKPVRLTTKEVRATRVCSGGRERSAKPEAWVFSRVPCLRLGAGKGRKESLATDEVLRMRYESRNRRPQRRVAVTCEARKRAHPQGRNEVSTAVAKAKRRREGNESAIFGAFSNKNNRLPP